MNTIVLFTRATLTQEVGQGLVNILQKHFLILLLYVLQGCVGIQNNREEISWLLNKKKARCQVF